jgi:hypothetical protein
VLASLYWVKIVGFPWTSKFDGSILCHFATYIHHLLISITREDLGPSLKVFVECFFCYLWVNEWCTLNKEILFTFCMKNVLYLQRVKKLFTFSPSFHHPINDDIVVLRVGESPRVGGIPQWRGLGWRGRL